MGILEWGSWTLCSSNIAEVPGECSFLKSQMIPSPPPGSPCGTSCLAGSRDRLSPACSSPPLIRWWAAFSWHRNIGREGMPKLRCWHGGDTELESWAESAVLATLCDSWSPGACVAESEGSTCEEGPSSQGRGTAVRAAPGKRGAPSRCHNSRHPSHHFRVFSLLSEAGRARRARQRTSPRSSSRHSASHAKPRRPRSWL